MPVFQSLPLPLPVMRQPLMVVGSIVLMVLGGCSPAAEPTSPATETSGPATEQASPGTSENAATAPSTAASSPPAEFVFEAPTYEATAEQLLASRLEIEPAREGWVRLFDAHTFFGWAIAGEANWQIEEGTILVDQGDPCLLTTTTRWADFELELQFRADSDTNSGVFVRSIMDPKDLETDCLEINIAPPENPFPTGSIVEHKRGEAFDGEAEQWHTMNIRCDGPRVRVQLNGDTVCELNDASSPREGFIGLQHNAGRVAFRDVRLRPLGFNSLLDEDLSQWKRYPDMPGEFRVNEDGHLVVDGGKQQLESRQTYGDFTLLAEYRMDDPASNSGLFFRSIPGAEMMGYECQVSNEIVDGNPLQPADGGAGGIFRRQDARVVAGEPGRDNVIVLAVRGPHFAGWVNGLQVSDVFDTRQPDENPRRGLRLEPGTVIVQGHDPTTQAEYRQISIAEFP